MPIARLVVGVSECVDISIERIHWIRVLRICTRSRSNHIAGNPHSAASSQSIDLIFLEPYAVLVVTEVGNFLFLHSF